jgi:hypothetical protein
VRDIVNCDEERALAKWWNKDLTSADRYQFVGEDRHQTSKGVLWNHIDDANRNRLAALHPKATLETVKAATSPQPHEAYPRQLQLRRFNSNYWSKRDHTHNRPRCSTGRDPMSVHELKALARKHCEEWLPEKVAELKREGRLNEELQAAAVMAQEEIESLMKNSHYSVHESGEVALPQFGGPAGAQT